MLNNKKVYIVNLSCLHKLHPIYTGILAFTKLCKYYHANSLSSMLCFPYDLVWVIAQFSLEEHKDIISDYKLGKIDTQTFLNKALKVFNFLNDQNNKFQLIIDAWNSIISFDAEHDERLTNLLEMSREEDSVVYLVSNTNEIHVQKIFSHFQEVEPNAWNHEAIYSLKEINSSTNPVALGPNIFFGASYIFGSFKSPNSGDLPLGTPGLIEMVTGGLETQGYTKEKITIISQFSGDHATAKDLGIASCKDNEFFSILSTRPRLKPN